MFRPSFGAVKKGSDGVFAALARADPHGFFHRGHKDFAVTNAASLRRLLDGFEHLRHETVGDDDLDHQDRLRRAFDPLCRANPGKVIPMGHSCADIQALRRVPTGVWG